MLPPCTHAPFHRPSFEYDTAAHICMEDSWAASVRQIACDNGEKAHYTSM